MHCAAYTVYVLITSLHYSNYKYNSKGFQSMNDLLKLKYET